MRQNQEGYGLGMFPNHYVSTMKFQSHWIFRQVHCSDLEALNHPWGRAVHNRGEVYLTKKVRKQLLSL